MIPSSTLSQIEAKKQKLDALRPLSREQLSNLKNHFDIEFTYNSNAIEGSTLTYTETKLILNEGLTIGGRSIQEHLEAINHKEAIEYIESLTHLKPSDLKLKDIKDLHFLILKSIDTQNAGRFRDIAVGVRKSDGEIFGFTDPLKIDDQMRDFIEWLSQTQDMHPVERAVLTHYKFVTIHPFVDGNGRTARLLMNLLLIQYGYPMAIIRAKNRVEYIQTLEIAQDGEGVDAFAHFIAKEIDDTLDTYLHIVTNNIKVI